MTMLDFSHDHCLAQAKLAKDEAFNSGDLTSKIQLIEQAQQWTDLAAFRLDLDQEDARHVTENNRLKKVVFIK